jgi:hypothetical protein
MAVPPQAAAIANTVITPRTGVGNVPEDLADLIYEIEPFMTPVVSAIGNKEATQPVTDWLVQQLNAADDNAQPEGFRYTAQGARAPDRFQNVCQIMFRAVTVSNTFRASNSVGGDEFDRQTLLKGKEVRRDLEWTITRATIKTTTDPRRMSGFQTWVTNGSMGATGSLATAGNGTTAPTAGTARTLILDMVADAMQQAYTQGGHPSLVVMSPRLKRVFTGLAQGGAGNAIVAQNIVQATQPAPVTIVGAVDVYLSDFGKLQTAPDIFMPDNILQLWDPDYAEIAPLPGRDMVQEEFAKVGDAADGGVIFEGTLRMTAPRAHAMVGDLS